MAHICRNSCVLGCTKSFDTITPSIAYFVANRCTYCSTNEKPIWYLKWVDRCPCCRHSLRKVSKHLKGRRELLQYNNLRKNNPDMSVVEAIRAIKPNIKIPC